MVKLVDVPDLGSGAARRVGSSPIIRTEASTNVEAFFYFFSICSATHFKKISFPLLSLDEVII